MPYNGLPASVPFPSYYSWQLLARGIAALHKKQPGCGDAPHTASRSPGPQLAVGEAPEDGLETWHTAELHASPQCLAPLHQDGTGRAPVINTHALTSRPSLAQFC